MSKDEKTNKDLFSPAEHNLFESFLNKFERQLEPPSTKKATKKRATPYEKGTKTGRARKAPHELLSEEQKKANHIASEQKRRANIRIGFEQLVHVVPALDTTHRSEAIILQKSVEYIKRLIDDKNKLKDKVRQLQLTLGETPDPDSSEDELDYPF
ncbi:Putative Heteromeric Ino2p/Ino4p transcription factor [Rhizopus microsporus]|nr:Putative Heteromeric Ino2p/Ino4p transcription factor [Rhizopus microsporus]